MSYCSTRDKSATTGFIEAVLRERPAADALYMPSHFNHPVISWMPDFAEFAAQFLYPFVAPDLGRAETLALCRRAFTFPVQWRELSARRYQLELFHGPSGSFKDFSAQFLAQVLAVMPSDKTRLIAAAVLPDHGAALASAFHGIGDIQVALVFPKSEFTARQIHQIASFGDNIQAFAVDGSLQDCQRLVDDCLKSEAIQEQFAVTPVTDINIGWILPQVVYYAYNSLLSERLHREYMNIIIPTGDGVHLVAACWAKAMGYPINEIVVAQGEHAPIVDYLAHIQKGRVWSWEDDNLPNNLLRLQALFERETELVRQLQAYSVSDAAIKGAIAHCFAETGMALSPQTAVAYNGLPTTDVDPRAWTIAATAHPAKYNSYIEPVIGAQIPVPERLANQLNQPAQVTAISAEAEQLLSRLLKGVIVEAI